MSAEEFLELCDEKNLKIVFVQIDDLTSAEAVNALIRAVKEIEPIAEA